MMISLLRLSGAKIGQGCFISMYSKIASKHVIIGNDVIIKKGVRIKTNALTIGNSCVISEDCYLTGSHNLSIGDTSYLGKKVRINASRDVVIGRDVGLGEGSVIWTHGYFPPADEGYPITYKPVVIKDKAWVSTSIIILPGVTIGEQSIIGAGSVVTKSVPDGVIVAGNPAREVKMVDDIIKPKPFLSLMEEILGQFQPKKQLDAQNLGNILIYKYRSFRIIVFDKPPLETIQLTEEDIVIFKHVKKEELTLTKSLSWFDFNDRIQQRNSNSAVKKLNHFFRGYGMRFVIE